MLLFELSELSSAGENNLFLAKSPALLASNAAA
jgi:hypothetical protein